MLFLSFHFKKKTFHGGESETFVERLKSFHQKKKQEVMKANGLKAKQLPVVLNLVSSISAASAEHKSLVRKIVKIFFYIIYN